TYIKNKIKAKLGCKSGEHNAFFLNYGYHSEVFLIYAFGEKKIFFIIHDSVHIKADIILVGKPENLFHNGFNHHKSMGFYFLEKPAYGRCFSRFIIEYAIAS